MPFVQMNVQEEIQKRKDEMESFSNVWDGRLTEPSDGKRYEWRKMIEKVKRIGRPLTDEESEEFRIK